MMVSLLLFITAWKVRFTFHVIATPIREDQPKSSVCDCFASSLSHRENSVSVISVYVTNMRGNIWRWGYQMDIMDDWG